MVSVQGGESIMRWKAKAITVSQPRNVRKSLYKERLVTIPPQLTNKPFRFDSVIYSQLEETAAVNV